MSSPSRSPLSVALHFLILFYLINGYSFAPRKRCSFVLNGIVKIHKYAHLVGLYHRNSFIRRLPSKSFQINLKMHLLSLISLVHKMELYTILIDNRPSVCGQRTLHSCGRLTVLAETITTSNSLTVINSTHSCRPLAVCVQVVADLTNYKSYSAHLSSLWDFALSPYRRDVVFIPNSSNASFSKSNIDRVDDRSTCGQLWVY